jgi:hypothetical protein
MLDLYLCTLMCTECLSSGLGWCPHTLFGVYYTQDKKKKGDALVDHTVFCDLNMLSETDGSPFKNFVTLVLSVVQLLFFILNNFNILFQR